MLQRVNESKQFPAICNDLTISNTAELTINPNKALTVNGNLIIMAKLSIKSTTIGDGSLIVEGNVSNTYYIERYLLEIAGTWFLLQLQMLLSKYF